MQTVDLALDGKERVNALHRLQGDRRHGCGAGPAPVFGRLADQLATDKQRPYDHAVVDECQDLGVAEARFLGVLASGQPDGLFFTGDLGQRIFQQPFSWKALGLDVRGRINYRTSHQIRLHADRLLPLRFPMSMAMPKGGAERFRCSTARRHW